MFFHRRSEAQSAGARDTAESPAHDPWYQVHAAATADHLAFCASALLAYEAQSSG